MDLGKILISKLTVVLPATIALFFLLLILAIFIGSPDFSETLREWVSSYFDENEVRCIKDIAYSTGRSNLKADLYLPVAAGNEKQSATKRPAVVIVHGGSWAKGSKSDFQEISIARFFARNNYLALSVDYTLSGDGKGFPDDVMEIKEALFYLGSNSEKYGIHPGRIFLLGNSSGATTAMIAAYTGCKSYTRSEKCWPVAAVASISGPSDLRTESANPYVQEYLHSNGKTPDLKRLLAASPISYVSSAVPTILLHGTEDRNVAIEQALELERLLRQAKIRVSMVRIEGQGHFIGAASRREALKLVSEFFSAAQTQENFDKSNLKKE